MTTPRSKWTRPRVEGTVPLSAMMESALADDEEVALEALERARHFLMVVDGEESHTRWPLAPDLAYETWLEGQAEPPLELYSPRKGKESAR